MKKEYSVIVIGGGNSALEEGIFLSGFTKKVKIINRNSEFSASQTYVDKVPDIDNIETYHNKDVIEFKVNEQGLFAGLVVKSDMAVFHYVGVAAAPVATE